MTYPYVKYELNMYKFWGDNEWKLKISFFSKLKGYNSAKNHRTMTKLNYDLCILMTYPYIIKYELNMYIFGGDNEWKLKISYYFQSEWGITLLKIIEP
jgi:hypothetical protein